MRKTRSREKGSRISVGGKERDGRRIVKGSFHWGIYKRITAVTLKAPGLFQVPTGP